jgi:PIN domain nuclease of toxin-antitoxin system
MKLMLDTHILLWSLFDLKRLPQAARELMERSGNEICFSVVNIWEISIKSQQGRKDFLVDPRLVRKTLLESGYTEIAVEGKHAEQMDKLPLLHRDPFDRMLIQQAEQECAVLLTADKSIGQYTANIRLV